MYAEKKSLKIKKDIETSMENPSRNLWKGLKRTLNWKGGGGPGELRDKSGRIQSNPEAVANIYHDKFLGCSFEQYCSHLNFSYPVVI